MSQPTWKEIQAAIAQAIGTASGLTTIWANQNRNQPAADYVRLSLGFVATKDVDWVDERYVDTNPPHQQIELTTAGTREVALQIEAWSAAVVESDAEATARTVVDAIVTRLRLPTARNALRAVGVVPFDPGPTNWIPQVVAANFRGRAVCDVRCRMPARALKEYADWIASMIGTATIPNGPGGEIDEPIGS